jgi:hypothetical protein
LAPVIDRNSALSITLSSNDQFKAATLWRYVLAFASAVPAFYFSQAIVLKEFLIDKKKAANRGGNYLPHDMKWEM